MALTVEQLIILALVWFILGIITGIRLARPENRF